MVLEELLSARAKAKKELKQAAASGGHATKWWVAGGTLHHSVTMSNFLRRWQIRKWEVETVETVLFAEIGKHGWRLEGCLSFRSNKVLPIPCTPRRPSTSSGFGWSAASSQDWPFRMGAAWLASWPVPPWKPFGNFNLKHLWTKVLWNLWPWAVLLGWKKISRISANSVYGFTGLKPQSRSSVLCPARLEVIKPGLEYVHKYVNIVYRYMYNIYMHIVITSTVPAPSFGSVFPTFK